MYKKSVSIITPFYNASEFIEATSKSVLGQTFTDFEWLIIDDCSTDGSEDILREIASSDSRVRVIRQPKNGGPMVARNTGFEKAQGRYIALIDADDIWLPEKLETQLQALQETGAVLCSTGYKKINKDGSIRSGVTIRVPTKITYGKLLFTDSIMASSALIDSSITGRLEQDIHAPMGRDDYDFFLKIIKEHGPGVGIKRDLARLRVFSESLTGNKIKAARLQWKYYRQYLHLGVISSIQKFCIYAFVGLIKVLALIRA
jgi:teichuronic acid biosynthesis glycosyltransferase TuaG